MEPTRKKQRVSEITTPEQLSEEAPSVVVTETTTSTTTSSQQQLTVVVQPPSTVVDTKLDDLWSANESAVLELLNALSNLEETSCAPFDAIETSTAACWLELKSVQRHVLTRLANSMAEVETKRQALERSTAVLDNILYEQSYWKQQIEQCLAFETPQLEQMCRDEQQQQQQQQNHQLQKQATTKPTAAVETSTDATSVQDVMNSFLCQDTSLSFADPQYKTRILQKLHQEIHLRGTLERDVKEVKRQLKDRKRQVQSKHVLLNDLPNKLQEMERSSRNLQRLFHSNQINTNNNNNTNNDDTYSSSSTVHLIGTERRERLDLAQLLPGPLYSLFVHLQHVLDTTVTATPPRSISLEVKPITAITSTATTTATAISVDGWEAADRVVLLQLPVPDVISSGSSNSSSGGGGGGGSPITTSSNSKKAVTIQFTYLIRHGFVAAKAYGSSLEGTFLDTTMLIDQLFPGDTGDDTNSIIGNQQVATATASNTATAFPFGKYYHWCNYIAGLHFPLGQQQSPTQQQQDLQQLKRNQHCSTRVVVRELMRRVRAQVVLTHLLSNFRLRKPHSIPAHPAMEQYFVAGGDHGDTMADTPVIGTTATTLLVQLVKFQEVTIGAANSSLKRGQERSFAFTIQRAAATCQGTVTIDVVRYPAVPPVWSLQATTTNLAEQGASVSSLQDGTNPVYEEALAKIERAINDEELETLVKADVEETFDWILAHQLRRLMQKWDRWQVTGVSGNNSGNHNITSGGGARVCRGRDRTSVVL